MVVLNLIAANVWIGPVYRYRYTANILSIVYGTEPKGAIYSAKSPLFSQLFPKESAGRNLMNIVDPVSCLSFISIGEF